MCDFWLYFVGMEYVMLKCFVNISGNKHFGG